MSKPYFRDFSRMSKEFKGKSWFAPTSIFRADKALYFPNLMGRTLTTSERVNTTNTLVGRISVVSVFSSTWAERQTTTFVDSLMQDVPALREGKAQRVDINIEENWLKAALVKMFLGGLRKRLPQGQHDKYFLVTKGLTPELRHNIGLWNSKVGYVYLLDENCRIRWAGSGDAEPGEKMALDRGIARLVAAQDLEKKLETDAEKEAKTGGS
jgi:ATPase complex subunit ATP10